jgi:hypothetical protein
MEDGNDAEFPIVLVVVVAVGLLAVKKTRTTRRTTNTTPQEKARGFQIVSVILSSLALYRERAD